MITSSPLIRGRLTVDVSRLRFLDAAGLGLLLTIHDGLVGRGQEGIVVRGARGVVRRVFEMTGLSDLLEDALPALLRTSGQLVERARLEAGLPLKDLYVAYFALGGRLLSPI